MGSSISSSGQRVHNRGGQIASIGGSLHSSNPSTTSLRMVFDQLSSAIGEATSRLGGKPKMTEKNISASLREVRRALLDADVNLEIADALIEGVRSRSLGQEVTKGVTAEQQFVKAIYDELVLSMGGDPSVTPDTSKMMSAPPAATLAYKTGDKPAVVLLAGLQGAGKTTAAGKLALYLKEREIDYEAVLAKDETEITEGGDGAIEVEKAATKGKKKKKRSQDDDPKSSTPSPSKKKVMSVNLPTRNRKVLIAAADVYRPAAISQLEILGERAGIDVFSLGTDIDPVEIARQALEKAIEGGYDTLLIDTAGRQVVDADLMDELKRMKEAVNPDETILVVDSMIGQEAASLTASFDDAVGITGAILTKTDGDSRGGAALSVRGVSGKPIKFMGTGEGLEDLEPFYPDRMASRILGMGDVVSLVEKAAADVTEDEAREMEKKMREAKFDFNDFIKQQEYISKMGGLGGVAKMLPGMKGMDLSDSKVREAEKRLIKNKAMICSMTKKERSDPELLMKDKTARSRLERITTGSGTELDDGLTFMGEFQNMRNMMKQMSKQMDDRQKAEDGGGMDMNDMAAMGGNRAARRKAKKKKKGGRGGGKGFA